MAAASFHISHRDWDAVIFDLDGVVTRTAKVHAAAWKKLFDEYLERRSAGAEGSFQPFDLQRDYREYVDGKPRYQGVQSFLESRGIRLSYGDPADGPERETICGLGNRKNILFHEQLRSIGVEVYDSTVDLIGQLRARKIRTAIVSSSRNCAEVLETAGLSALFDARVDGVVAEQRQLTGKPSPDIFLAAARDLDVDPKRTVVVEDAIAGVQAGRRGGFGRVIGVDRGGQAEALRENGADLVVGDLADIGASPDLPSALDCLEEIRERCRARPPVIFLDYDGTLTPIVPRPEDAVLSESARRTLRRLASRFPVAVISGRDLAVVRSLVGVSELFYAGSHGFDIAGPEGRNINHQPASDYLPALDAAEKELLAAAGAVAGASVERKRFSVAVHYRNADASAAPRLEKAVRHTLDRHPHLLLTHGKKVYDLRPAMDWHKGRALLWLLERMHPEPSPALPLYIGDDVTDEDAFRILKETGIGIVVGLEGRESEARYALEDPEQVRLFLDELASTGGRA